MLYIDLNMVRAGVVHDPGKWRWSGYDELAGHRQRYRLIDREVVLRSLGENRWERLAADYRSAMERRLAEGERKRNPIWTESVAVGGEAFIRRIRREIRNRSRIEEGRNDDGTCFIRESPSPYTRFLEAKKQS